MPSFSVLLDLRGAMFSNDGLYFASSSDQFGTCGWDFNVQFWYF